MSRSSSVTPAAMAGVIPSVWWILAKLWNTAYSATWYAWFATFFENPLVSRVNRLLAIRKFRFDRSTYNVLMYLSTGWPVIATFRTDVHNRGAVAPLDLHLRARRPVSLGHLREVDVAADRALHRLQVREEAVRRHRRQGEPGQPAAGVRAERLDELSLRLGADRVEHERRLAAAAHAGEGGEPVLRNVDVDALKVGRAGASDLDGGHRASSSLTGALAQPRQSRRACQSAAGGTGRCLSDPAPLPPARRRTV